MHHTKRLFLESKQDKMSINTGHPKRVVNRLAISVYFFLFNVVKYLYLSCICLGIFKIYINLVIMLYECT